jgi:hypothetical protein
MAPESIVDALRASLVASSLGVPATVNVRTESDIGACWTCCTSVPAHNVFMAMHITSMLHSLGAVQMTLDLLQSPFPLGSFLF